MAWGGKAWGDKWGTLEGAGSLCVPSPSLLSHRSGHHSAALPPFVTSLRLLLDSFFPSPQYWTARGRQPQKGSFTFCTEAGIWEGGRARLPVGPPPMGLSLWALPRWCPRNTQRPGGAGGGRSGGGTPAAQDPSTGGPSQPSSASSRDLEISVLTGAPSLPRMWQQLPQAQDPHLYRLLLVGRSWASHKAPSVEEGRWAPPSGPLPRVLGSLPFAARFRPA